jgi:hypothetical protein
MINSSLNQLSTLLATRQVSSVELTRDFLGHIKTLNKEYNAFITINEEISLDLESVKESVNFCKRPDVGLREVALKANSNSIVELNIFAVAHYMIKTRESVEVADSFIANIAMPVYSRRDISNPTYVLRKYLDRRKYEGSVEFSKAGKMIAFIYGLAYLHMNDQSVDDFERIHGEKYNKFILENPNSKMSRMPDFFGSLENMVF